MVRVAWRQTKVNNLQAVKNVAAIGVKYPVNKHADIPAGYSCECYFYDNTTNITKSLMNMPFDQCGKGENVGTVYSYCK